MARRFKLNLESGTKRFLFFSGLFSVFFLFLMLSLNALAWLRVLAFTLLGGVLLSEITLFNIFSMKTYKRMSLRKAFCILSMILGGVCILFAILNMPLHLFSSLTFDRILGFTREWGLWIGGVSIIIFVIEMFTDTKKGR